MTLAGLKNDAYNGLRVVLEPNPGRSLSDRIFVRLANGKKISVPYTAVDTSDFHLEECAICASPCFPGYTTRTACKHVFHTSCLVRWRSTAKDDVEAPGNRCPLCRAYLGQIGGAWSSMPAMQLITIALGAICQIHARQNGMKEPSLEEEMEFVLRCMQQTATNKQANYSIVDSAVSALKQDPQSLEKQAKVVEVIKATLVMHVFHEVSVDSSYTEAILMWLTTLSLE